MRKIKLISLFLIILCICFTGCAAGKEKSDVKKLQNAEGEFQYPGLAWGSSLADVEALFKTESVFLGGMEDGTESYQFSGVFQESSCRVELICEFQKDALTWITFSLFPEGDGEEFFEEMKNALFDAYGTVEALVSEQEVPQINQKLKTETYIWTSESGSTMQNLYKMYRDNELTSIMLSIYPALQDSY